MKYNRICISSGHGLYVRGASGCLDERDQNVRVTDQLAIELKNFGIEALTFHDNTSKDQSANLNTIVNWHNKQTRDLDVSIHFNAYNGTANGTECLYLTQPELAQDVSDAVASCGFVNRGAKKRTDLKFLNATDEPAILVETCFCDSTKDCDTYNKQFGMICSRIAQVLAGEGEPAEEVPPTTEEDEPLFYARGTCSYFGGPEDQGVSASEGLAFIYSIDETNQHLFLPLIPKGTTGLARRLNAKAVHYLACRWDYSVTPKEMLASQKYVALVRVPKTGAALTAWPADWGPHEEKTGRAADLSPALMADLEIETDDEVEVIFPWEG